MRGFGVHILVSPLLRILSRIINDDMIELFVFVAIGLSAAHATRPEILLSKHLQARPPKCAPFLEEGINELVDQARIENGHVYAAYFDELPKQLKASGMPSRHAVSIAVAVAKVRAAARLDYFLGFTEIEIERMIADDNLIICVPAKECRLQLNSLKNRSLTTFDNNQFILLIPGSAILSAPDWAMNFIQSISSVTANRLKQRWLESAFLLEKERTGNGGRLFQMFAQEWDGSSVDHTCNSHLYGFTLTFLTAYQSLVYQKMLAYMDPEDALECDRDIRETSLKNLNENVNEVLIRPVIRALRLTPENFHEVVSDMAFEMLSVIEEAK